LPDSFLAFRSARGEQSSLFGPILTLGLLGTLAGNVAASLAYLVNACNGFLVSVLARSAEVTSAIPYAVIETPGATLSLVGLF
jgi:hypothetical protein